MKDKMGMVEKLVVSRYPELRGSLIWNYTISRDLLFGFQNHNVYKTKETLILKAPLKYRDQILLISKVVGIFFDHMFWDEKEVTFEL